MAELGKKLQLKTDSHVLLLNAPDGFAKVLAGEGYTYENATEVPESGAFEAVQLFVRNVEELNRFVPQVVPLLKPNVLFWIAYPKKSSGIKTDLSRDDGWKAVTVLGYESTRLVSLDTTWSSARYRRASERAKPSVFGIDLPGIDRKTKTVIVPDDMQEALRQAGVESIFDKLAFTHRKEYVLAVLDAKRPETKAKRMQKIIDDLQAKGLKV
ncbi:YdeI/OmpD-associated family protein [uncultured Pontibacter sp.]|uniref:YdeI/OmpD-associated family protein n=1 Tax=uncultured Pontibacter sp. TaxID=453356 RepID=UPI00262A60D5|nr:YdeI/OmpD-associated family protein [uncultured Pontibacter sp.]